MKIMVNGDLRELEAIGINDVEWTRDLLGNYGALHYDYDLEECIMTEDEFSFWELVIDKLNEIDVLEQELDEKLREKYNMECWSCDLENEASEKLDWLRNHVGA